jgi:hypothetical protein
MIILILFLHGKSQWTFRLVEIVPTLIIILILFFSAPLVLRFLWNNTIYHIFKVEKINYWQSIGLFMLSFLLIGIWNVFK